MRDVTPRAPRENARGFTRSEVRAAATVLVAGLAVGLLASVFLLHPLRIVLDGLLPVPAPWNRSAPELAVPQVIRDIFGSEDDAEPDEVGLGGVGGAGSGSAGASDVADGSGEAGGATDGQTAAGDRTDAESEGGGRNGATESVGAGATPDGGVVGEPFDGGTPEPGTAPPATTPPSDTPPASAGPTPEPIPTDPATPTPPPVPSLPPPPPSVPAPTPVPPPPPPSASAPPAPSPTEPPEPTVPECSDGTDNDGDGLVDTGLLGLFGDPDCADPSDSSESS